jgi:hypothetical protein
VVLDQGWKKLRKSVEHPGELLIPVTKEIVMMQVLEFFRIFIVGNDNCIASKHCR